MSTNEVTFISFYPDEEAQGGALRENLIVKREPMHMQTIMLAQKKAKELKAKSFVMFKVIPRVWVVEDEE